jgi:D-3-phosphoglycerate dehydrogenase
MREGAILINTARGGLVDQEALLEALQAGKLRATGLDAFEAEPLRPSHIFSGIPNVILTPHVGGITSDTYVSMGTAAARNILTVLAEVTSSTA